MKKLVYVALLSGLIIMGMTMAISCSTASTTTSATPKPGGAQTSPPPGQTPGPDFQPAAVSIENFSFVPASLTVKIGTTVTWTNNDAATHTITSNTGAFESQNLANGGTFSFTFDKTGVYEYHCAIHSSMKGTITVQ
jgi:plastocyanin